MKIMLSIFPELLFLAPFAAFLMRVALGGVFTYAAMRHLQSSDGTLRSFAVFEAALATALLAGAWTQPAAILSMLLIGTWFAFPKLRTTAPGTATLSLLIALSLLLTGAGPLAFDLPL